MTDAPIRLRDNTVLIAAISCAVLLLQINLTRIFSYLLLNHFVTLAVSIPFIGLGSAGSMLAIRPLNERLRSLPMEEWLLRQAVFFSITLVVSLLVIAKLPLNLLELHRIAEPAKLLLFISVITVPFYFAGLIVCALLWAARENTGVVYAADLTGAVLGCILALPAIRFLGADATVYWIACLISLLYVSYGCRKSGARFRVIGVATILTGLALSLILPAHAPLRAGVTKDQRQWEDVFYKKDLCDEYARVTNSPVHCPDRYRADLSRWNLIARVDVINPVPWISAPSLPAFGGVAGKGTRPRLLNGRMIYQDGSAPTLIVDLSAARIEEQDWVEHLSQSVGFVIKKPPGDVAIVGVGGGPDVIVALYHKARSITGIEINPVIVSLLKTEFREFSGALVEQPSVKIVNMEGRSFFTLSRDSYDLIQLSGVDTYAAVSSGSLAVAESYLYTVEALRDMYARLKPDGLIVISRWRFTPPRETLRIANIMREAVEREGVDPATAARQVLIIGSRGELPWASAVLRKGPFTADEVQAVEKWAADEDFEMIYAKDSAAVQPSEFTRILDAPDRRGAAEGYFYDVRATTDDWPFFFNFYRWDRLFSKPPKSFGGYEAGKKPIAYTLAIVTTLLASLLAIVLIWLPLRGSGSGRGGARRLPFVFYFAGLAFGFIFIELSLVQRVTILVGGPVYALSVVLSALLLSTGAGSFFSSRLQDRVRQVIVPAILAVLGCGLLVYLVGYRLLFPALMRQGEMVRIVGVVLCILPLGFSMGPIFPLGLRLFCAENEDQIPYAWSINTSLTVVGSNLSLLIPTFTGISQLLLIGLLAYAISLCAGFLRSREPSVDSLGRRAIPA